MIELTPEQKRCLECYKNHCTGENSFEQCPVFREYAETDNGLCISIDVIKTDRIKWRKGVRESITLYGVCQELEKEGFDGDSEMLDDLEAKLNAVKKDSKTDN